MDCEWVIWVTIEVRVDNGWIMDDDDGEDVDRVG